MIDPANLPPLRTPGFRWLQPRLGGDEPMTDRVVVEYEPLRVWVALVQEARSSAGYRATVGMHRPEDKRAAETWLYLHTAAKWVVRWVEAREDRILHELERMARSC